MARAQPLKEGLGVEVRYMYIQLYMGVSLNYCSQNGGNLYRAPYYNGNPNIGPRIIGNLDQYPYTIIYEEPQLKVKGLRLVM